MVAEQWGHLFGRGLSWQDTYPILEDAVRAYLDKMPDARTLATSDLARALWPIDARAEYPTAVSGFFRALDAIAKHGCADYVTHEMDTGGIWAQRLGKPVKVKRWHRVDPNRPKLAPAAEAIPRATEDRTIATKADTDNLASAITALEASMADLARRLEEIEAWRLHDFVK